MPLSDLAQKLRATMPDESPIDLDDHAERIAAEVERVQREPFACACVGGDPCPCRQAAWDRGEPWDRDREAFAAGKDKP